MPGTCKKPRLFLIVPILAYFSVSCNHAIETTAKNERLYRTVVPEYDRSMKKVVISLGHQNITFADTYKLLALLPSYTSIYLFLPDSSIESAQSYLHDTQLSVRTTLVLFNSDLRNKGYLHFLDQNSEEMVTEKITKPVPLQFGTIWTQDLFEVVTNPDSTQQLVGSNLHMFVWTENNDARDPAADNDYLYQFASQGMGVIKLPLVFNGGNMLFDEIGGNRIALLGGDIVKNTRTVRSAFPGAVVPDSEIEKVIKDAFNVDKVVIISGKDRPQPTLMYHLDQAVLLLPNGVAGVTSIIGSLPDNPRARTKIIEVEEYLKELRRILTELGYTVVDIETTVQNVLDYEYYANSIPFIHAVTGERMLLMPDFSDDRPSLDATIAQKNTKLFESLGYRVIVVPSHAQKVKAGPHCMINVLE